MAGKDLLIKAIENLKINFKIITHPEVFTVEAMMPYLNEVDGLVCKNLFVKDKKKETTMAGYNQTWPEGFIVMVK